MLTKSYKSTVLNRCIKVYFGKKCVKFSFYKETTKRNALHDQHGIIEIDYNKNVIYSDLCLDFANKSNHPILVKWQQECLDQFNSYVNGKFIKQKRLLELNHFINTYKSKVQDAEVERDQLLEELGL